MSFGRVSSVVWLITDVWILKDSVLFCLQSQIWLFQHDKTSSTAQVFSLKASEACSAAVVLYFSPGMLQLLSTHEQLK